MGVVVSRREPRPSQDETLGNPPKAVSLLKANSSKWMGEQGKDFSWQEAYGAFSVSSSNLDRVARYVENQEAHHRKTSFEDEFRALLRKHGVESDPKYVFA